MAPPIGARPGNEAIFSNLGPLTVAWLCIKILGSDGKKTNYRRGAGIWACEECGRVDRHAPDRCHTPNARDT